MNKNEWYRIYKNKEIQPIAVIGLTNNSAIEILDIEHGVDDTVIGVINGNQIFKRKLYYNSNDSYFKLGNIKYSMSEAIRI